MSKLWCLIFAAPLAFAQFRQANSPAWLASGVIYEVNPRTFSASGDFRGIERRLSELKQLGVNILWLMPIHPSGKARSKGSIGSPYAVRDYYAVNSSYGSKADFKHLVDSAHGQGFKVIIDVVANHTAWDSVLMKWPDFYKHGPDGKVIPPEPGWADVAALNYDNPKVGAYMIAMLQYWVREFALDGFRCDVAGKVPVAFWNEARAALEKQKPDIFMLAEWHEPDLLVRAFDVDYSWPLHSKLTEVFQKGAPAAGIEDEWNAERRTYPAGSLHLRFSDNHDEKRAIARFGEGGALAASALMFTLDGVPMLYNGMEVGDTTESGAPALFERLPVFWEIGERRPEFAKFYKAMIKLRREHPALQQGETVWLKNNSPDQLITYLRRDRAEEFLVAINCSNQPLDGVITGSAPGRWTDALADHGEVAPGGFKLEAWGFRVLRAVK